MTFQHPWVLLALPILLVLGWAVARFGARAVPPRQHRLATIVRLLAFCFLVLALAQPAAVRPVDDRSVLFLLDRSDSVPEAARERQTRLVADAHDQARPSDRSAVAVFAEDVRVDAALATGRRPPPASAEVEGSATDLAGALQAAASLLPTEGSRRVVVVSDMVETTGDARQAARRLAEAGIAVDVVPIEGGRGPDALVESVRLPPVVREGDRVQARVVLRSNTVGPAVLRLRSGGATVSEQEVTLEAGRSEVDFALPVASRGFLEAEVEVDAAFDTRDENDRATGVAPVLGPPRVALVEGVPGEGEELSKALQAGGMEVDVRPDIPDSGRLLGFDAVVLVNVPEPPPERAEALAAFVEDLGRGLVVVGGDRAFGLGGYHETPLERVLPVSSHPDDLVRRQPVAEVLVIDTSGSMAACHCDGGAMSEGGVNKTDISRAGAALAIGALAETDSVGVLAFSSGFDWVIPLGRKPAEAEAERALATLSPEGDTEISAALEEALEQLRSAPEELRHIVLFTDGWDPSDADLLPIARRIADEGVTLSVLGTGEGPGSTLRRMADLGGGRYYPGTDLEAVPEVFVEETLTVARDLATEGSFLPALAAPSPVTQGLTSSPPLLGYVLTKAKGTASVSLEIGPGDPLLATWQRGLGRVSAWTSDATARWASGWVGWEGFVDLWGRLIREVLPPGRDVPPEVWVDGGALRVRLEVDDLEEGARAVARVRTPSGEVEAVPLDRTGASRFEGSTRASSPGAYWVAVTVEGSTGGGFTSAAGAVSRYAEELAFREPDPALAHDLAAITGGRVDPAPSDVFDPAPIQGRAEQPLWPLLVGVALGSFLLDVALRRLTLTRGDAELWRQGLTSERRRARRRVERALAERSERGEPLDEVVSDSETLQRLMRRKRG